jgi:hypothetical protein
MFELANQLLGVFTVADCSSSIAINQKPDEEHMLTGDWMAME